VVLTSAFGPALSTEEQAVAVPQTSTANSQWYVINISRHSFFVEVSQPLNNCTGYLRVPVAKCSEEILIQEIIPGDGSVQFSYRAFVRLKKARGTLLARSVRQHSREFGRAATYD
jgi:predicted ATP-grasp superfamily ATP-dependent carboligase